jgi:tryptophanyl-tRNA synthetase
MESFDHKMSKSDPNGAILLHDDENRLAKKMRKAFLDPEQPDSPVYELIEHIILPEFGEVIVTPKPEFGEPSVWTDLESFKAAVADGTLHPFDAKMGVAAGVSRGLDAVSKHFEANPDTLERVNQLTK